MHVFRTLNYIEKRQLAGHETGNDDSFAQPTSYVALSSYALPI